MTVCIGALADGGRSLVMACDSKLSAECFSADGVADKLYPLSSRLQWWAMFAGGDLTHIPKVIELATLALLPLNDDNNLATNVQQAMALAYQQVRKEHAQNLVLSPLNLTWADLRLKGDGRDSPWIVGLKDDLENVDLGFQMVVCGFDFAGDGQIFVVENPGITRDYGIQGWATVGSGDFSVTATLLLHAVKREMGLGQVLYHVCESKFMAESAEGVGVNTRLKVARAGHGMDAYELHHDVIDAARRAWEDEGRPRIPRGFGEHIEREISANYPKSPMSSSTDQT